MHFEKIRTSLAAWGEPAYRFRQVYEGATRGLARDYSELTALPVGLRERLAAEAPLRELTVSDTRESSDGTIKLGLHTHDGFPLEAVVMRHRNRRTACLSSQSGCPLACTFCATGAMGLGRNLTEGEIAEQLLELARLVRDRDGGRIGNVVMMGMGEPFLNYDAVLAACRTITDPDGYGMGARHVAISTAGWVPGIERLAEEPLQLRLALSLHAPTDELRTELMPVTKRFPLARLMQACRDYRERTGRRVFVEYLLLDGVNDARTDATTLARLLGGGDGFHVNLIAYNPTAAGYQASPPERVAAFASELRRGGVQASYRRSHGADIEAACGQLAREGAGARRRELRRAAVR
ncbi:MAG TPA: 23S rRNA (adenine(2503)-C(2))-methyltransferase RlmN [Gaiellales bacterium]